MPLVDLLALLGPPSTARRFALPNIRYHVITKEESSFANPHAMNDEQLREWDAAQESRETWAAYCKKLGVSVHSPRPTQPWDLP